MRFLLFSDVHLDTAPLAFGEHGARGAVLVDVHADGSVERRSRVVAASPAHDVVLRKPVEAR